MIAPRYIASSLQVQCFPHHCACSRLNARPLLHKRAYSNACLRYPLYHKNCCVNYAIGVSNVIIWAVTSMKCAKLIKHITHRSLCVWPRTTFGLWQRGRLEKFANFDQQISTSGSPTLRPLRIWGGQWGQHRVLLLCETWKPHVKQSCHKLVLGKRNITSLRTEHELVEEAKRYSLDVVGISSSVVVLTMLNWTVSGNSSPSALSKDSLHRLEWVYL